MRTKFAILFLTILALAGACAYYWAEYQKLEEVDALVRAWQQRMVDYVTFDYGTISTRLGPNTITLEQVYVTYPVLMSIDKLSISPLPEKETIENLNINAEGVNFTAPWMSGDNPWYGNLALDYDYDPSVKLMDLVVRADFPLFLQGKIQTTLLNIVPDVDIVFNYPEVLLATLNVQLQNLGLLQKAGQGQMSDPALLSLLDKLGTDTQQQAVAQFWANNQSLAIQFYPEHPVPIYRLLENDRLFWQHPAVQISN